MPPKLTFDEALLAILEQAQEEGASFEEVDYYVSELFKKYGRERPPPITGTMQATDPEDSFGG